jgi:acetyl-CoA C-acetyltransferase
MTTWRLKDPPSTFAQALGMNPTIREYTVPGGNCPQWLVNRVADNIAAGGCEIAVLTGCEAWNSARRAAKAGTFKRVYADDLEIPMVGISRPGTNAEEKAHSADRPIRIYPLIENALRAKEGLTLEQQRRNLGRFAEAFSSVAARNPHSWYPVARSAEEALTPTKTNRMVGFPYTKFLTACPADMAAALIMTTTEVASRLGVPREKWVYIHGGQDAHDEWFLSNRSDLADSPAIKAVVQDALSQAGVDLDSISFFDLYSCFPCMPRIACKALGITENDPRPLTITGGLPYFGGPGSNYVMHSIAEAVTRCRANPDAYGMITGNGMYCTKHGVGIYSGRSPERSWSRTPPERFQETLTAAEPLEVDSQPTGGFRVDSYTVLHDGEGEPRTGILCGRTPEGRRAWAQTREGDRQILESMMKEEWVGREGQVTHRNGKTNIVEFS